MIKLKFERTHPIEQKGRLVLEGDFRELRQQLSEIQSAKKYGYAKSFSDTDISREIIRIDQEQMR